MIGSLVLSPITNVYAFSWQVSNEARQRDTRKRPLTVQDMILPYHQSHLVPHELVFLG